MTGGAECVGENETLEQAARKMKDLDVGSLPICGEDNRLKGMLTDRDIVVKCLADGRDPRTATAGEFGQVIGRNGAAEGPKVLWAGPPEVHIVGRGRRGRHFAAHSRPGFRRLQWAWE